MFEDRGKEGFKPGIVSFDDYSNWTKNNYGYEYGLSPEHLGKIEFNKAGSPIHLTEDEKNIIKDNITKNVTDIADEHKDAMFYYFYTPYSILTYSDYISDGTIYKHIEEMEYATELILQHDNIKLYSLCDDMEIVTDMNNYRDSIIELPEPNKDGNKEYWDTSHYGEWINSYILQCMYNDKYRLTEENYKGIFSKQLRDYLNFDFDSLYSQVNYKNDYYQAALYNKKIFGVEPIDLLEDNTGLELKNAEIVEGQRDNNKGIKCIGSLKRSYDSNVTPEEFIIEGNYVGGKITIDDIGKHKYIVFYGRKVAGGGEPTVIAINADNEKISEISYGFRDVGNDWEQYLIDVSDQKTPITIFFNGGYLDTNGSPDTEYIFSDIKLY
nr:hypothetical protein [uncultured Lachnoanaerobaculum sp.]